MISTWNHENNLSRLLFAIWIIYAIAFIEIVYNFNLKIADGTEGFKTRA